MNKHLYDVYRNYRLEGFSEGDLVTTREPLPVFRGYIPRGTLGVIESVHSAREAYGLIAREGDSSSMCKVSFPEYEISIEAIPEYFLRRVRE